MGNVRKLVSLAFERDPRLKRAAKAEREAKAAEKKAKYDAKQKQLEEQAKKVFST